MSYFDRLAEMGFMVVCRRNRLGTTTVFAIREDDVCPEDNDLLLRRSGSAGNFSDVLEDLPEWRVADFVGDDAADGAQRLFEKLTLTGRYADWDERMAGLGLADKLIGFAHRPESERFDQWVA